MRLLDAQYTATPFYGSRRMTAWLRSQGYVVNRKRVTRLLRQMGIEAIYAKPKLSQPLAGHKIYPYLLRGVKIERVNHVWSTDIAYIRLQHGFLYLVAVIDWFSRYVLSWAVSITLDGVLCLEALETALQGGAQRSSTPTKERSLPVGPSPSGSATAASRSAWMAVAGRSTMCLWSACGGPSSTRRYIYGSTAPCGRHSKG